jgi:hypothetical protein
MRTEMPTRLNYEGTLYQFDRNRSGEGRWFVVSGRCPKLIGLNQASCAVPLELGHEISVAAKEQNLSEVHGFSRFPPKPVKPVRVPRTKGPRVIRRKGGLVGLGIKLAIAG